MSRAASELEAPHPAPADDPQERPLPQNGTPPPVQQTRNVESAFTVDFLARIDALDDPPTAAEAEMAGPWEVVPLPDNLFGVFRRWETGSGACPMAVFRDYETALLLTAVLPALGREPLFELASEPETHGYRLEGFRGGRAGEAVGWLRLYDPDVAAALHLAGCWVRSPLALAAQLTAAGPSVQSAVGRILYRELQRVST